MQKPAMRRRQSMEILQNKRPIEPSVARAAEYPAQGFRMRLASEVNDLQTALALEGARAMGGIDEPSIAPQCDFLMLFDRTENALGVIRLLPHPAGDVSRLSRSAGHIHTPLFTALRYARLGILEV